MALKLGPPMGRFEPAPVQLKTLKTHTAVSLGTGGSAVFEARRLHGGYDLRFQIKCGEGASDGGGQWYIDLPVTVPSGIKALGIATLQIPGSGVYPVTVEMAENSSRAFFRVPQTPTTQNLVYLQSWGGNTAGAGAYPAISGHAPNKAGATLNGSISIPPPRL